MTPIAKTYSVRDLQRNYRAILDTAKTSHDGILIINNSVPEAVILDVETYNALIMDSYTYDMPLVERLVIEARKSIQKGKAQKLVSWNDLDR